MRNVLAMLIAHADQVVPASSLATELWGDEPPASASTTVQTYLLNLRKHFATATGRTVAEISNELLVTRTGGYLLNGRLASLDLRRYELLAQRGRTALAEGDDVAAVRHLSEALRVWRGRALLDLPVGRLLEARRCQLEESRLVTLEYLVDVELRLGMHREVLTELAAVIVENPLHEGLHAQYMRALHLSGRRAQALEVFHRVRGNLVTELGLEPAAPVQRLHQAILNADSDIDVWSERRPLVGPPPSPVGRP
ncbi:transcriptional regulator [Micromonospora zingiberis]|uniref:Transcriptional regulator n=2 Tax=Micromonospora zingiberis TaxID=2053011 RepID=A0A4R0GKK2_9ACTN|nr:transcriptional regulator [Micromonospora zingiberis]